MYAFEAGVLFFGLDNLTVTLSYQKQGNDAAYTGTQTYSQEILGVSNPSISVVYNNTTDTWTFGGWQILQQVAQDINIIQKIHRRLQRHQCVLRQSCQNRASKCESASHLKPETDERAYHFRYPQNGSLPGVTGTFSLTLVNNTIYTVDIPTDPNNDGIGKQKIDTNNTSSLPDFIGNVFIESIEGLALSSSKKSRGADGAYYCHEHTGD